MMKMTGDVTTHVCIAGLSTSMLELRLGYKPGRLSLGYEIWELRDTVFVGDFVWGDQTSYSGGWHYQYGIEEYARRFDILRAEFGKKFGYDEVRVDLELNRFLEREAVKLNIRSGPDRIVKIRPKIDHDKNMFWLEQYPNSKTRETLQWTIIKPKTFEQTAIVAA